MAYTITLRVIQKTSDNFETVEKTCISGETWIESSGGYHELSMGGSGTSGMLRFQSYLGEAFCLSLGVHNHKRWCDIVVDLKDDETAKKIHPSYYVTGGSPMLWKQLSAITKTTARGTKLSIKYVVNEGTELSAELTILKAIKLLSLDSGGIRCLSALAALEVLMNILNDLRKQQRKGPVKPCEVFDMIAGTGTGGLIAILLGRLRMDVRECRYEYMRLMETIWQHSRASNGLLDSAVLRDAMTGLDGVNGTEPFCVEDDRQCRVFVCAKAHEINRTVRLRSYTLPHLAAMSGPPPTIAQIAQATCAASGIFAPVQIGARKYADGDYGLSNPVNQIWSEAQDIFCPDDGIIEPIVQCLVSIGSGNLELDRIDDNNMFATTLKVARDTESAAREFVGVQRSLYRQGRYFRFNVVQGLQEVEVEEHEKQGIVESAAEHYLTGQEQKYMLQDCARMLSGYDVA